MDEITKAFYDMIQEPGPGDYKRRVNQTICDECRKSFSRLIVDDRNECFLCASCYQDDVGPDAMQFAVNWVFTPLDDEDNLTRKVREILAELDGDVDIIFTKYYMDVEEIYSVVNSHINGEISHMDKEWIRRYLEPDSWLKSLEKDEAFYAVSILFGIMKDPKCYGVAPLYSTQAPRIRVMHALEQLKANNIRGYDLYEILSNQILQDAFHNHEELKDYEIFYKPTPPKEKSHHD